MNVTPIAELLKLDVAGGVAASVAVVAADAAVAASAMPAAIFVESIRHFSRRRNNFQLLHARQVLWIVGADTKRAQVDRDIDA